MYDQARKEFAKHGVLVDNVRVDVEKMMAHKVTAVSGLTKGIEGLFKKNKVKYVKGAGSLTSTPGVVQVEGLDGSTSLHTTKSILLATGSEVLFPKRCRLSLLPLGRPQRLARLRQH
jgi:dihydrolipoamide dehydrogenase